MGEAQGALPLDPSRDAVPAPCKGQSPLDPFSRLHWLHFHTSSACLSTGYPHVLLLPYWRQKAINIGKKSPCNPNDKPSRRCNNLETHPAHRRNASHQQYAADGRFRGGRAVESSRSDGSLGDCRSDGSADRDSRSRKSDGCADRDSRSRKSDGCADRDPCSRKSDGCAVCDPRSRKSDGCADRDPRSRKSDGSADRDTRSRKSDGRADRDTRSRKSDG